MLFHEHQIISSITVSMHFIYTYIINVPKIQLEALIFVLPCQDFPPYEKFLVAPLPVKTNNTTLIYVCSNSLVTDYDYYQ